MPGSLVGGLFTDLMEPQLDIPTHPSATPADLSLPALSGANRLAEALLRRTGLMLRTPDFELDLLERCVRYPDGEVVRFTPHQWRVLDALVQAAPAHVTTDALSQTFELDGAGDTHQVAVLIGQLRRKLEPDPRSPRYFRTIGAGRYAFDLEGRLPSHHPSASGDQ